MHVYNFRYIDPVAEIIDILHKNYGDQLAASQQSWRVRVSPPGLLLWGDSSQMKAVYDFVVTQAMSQGGHGCEISLTVIERGNMDECSVWCSNWRLDSEALYGSVDRHELDCQDETSIDMRSCRRIIEMHGGHMWIESAPNGWAKVIFVLPKRNTELS